MDFVLLGFGLGALLILSGRAVRTYGPLVRRKNLEPSVPFPAFAEALWWGRVCRGSGLVLALSGAFLCLITVILLLLDASDRAGMVILLLSTFAVLLVTGLWAALFAHPEWRRLERVPRRTTAGQAVRPSAAANGGEGGSRSLSGAALAAWPVAPSHRDAGGNGTATSGDTGQEPALPQASDASTSAHGLALPDADASGHPPERHDSQPVPLRAGSRSR